MPDDIKKLKIQVKHKEKTVKMMGDEFVLCVRLAEKRKGNGLKRKSDKTKEDIASLLLLLLLLNRKIKN